MAIIQTTLIAAAALGGLAVATYLLPRHVTVQRSAVVGAAPSDVLSMAASFDGYQRFNPYRSADPELKITPFGPPSGVGSGFAFDGKDGKGTQTVASITDTAVTYAIDMGPMGQPTQVLQATPSAQGSEVTWTMNADMGFNPVFRVFGLFMDGMMGKTLDQGLANLAAAN
ncbi:MAG: SRPBCC family protein [Pseudomonadota bacterium]